MTGSERGSEHTVVPMVPSIALVTSRGGRARVLVQTHLGKVWGTWSQLGPS